MAEPKPIASLSAGLLARKGAARPAMRRQAQLPGVTHSLGGHDDLGWNDMGYDVDPHDNAAEISRQAGQGLSPMERPGASVNDHSAHDAFEAAVDRVVPNQAPAHTPTVQPIHHAQAVPVQAEQPEVHNQMQRIERELTADPAPMQPVAAPVAAPAPAPIAPVVARTRAPRARAAAGAKGNFAFTLRLNPDRHLRLRLASATTNRSAQQILIDLLDDYLANLPEIDAFAAQLPASKTPN
ncbi:MAG: hypothetical protein ACKOUM_04555 [Sphingopyxis sp.]